MGMKITRGAAALCVALAACASPQIPPQPAPITLDALTEGQEAHGFSAQAIYTDDLGQVMGARFQHQHTGFVFDYLQIQSVPQAFIWVTTFPDSERGEPHTQEHLLLGKGNKGRYVSSQETLSLVSSSAFTQQYRTCYHLNTPAGPDVFFDILDARLDSLLNPDYTDEEIRREVHHYAVAADDTGALAVEEKGTVYQEMASTFERPGTRIWQAMGDVAWGVDHPLSLSSGGTPDAIRTMTAEHIRAFHASHYQLANMGMIGAFPGEVSADEVLARMDVILRGLQPDPTPADAHFMAYDELPAPAGAPPGALRFVDFPSASTEVPVDILLEWPAQLDLDPAELLVTQLFLQALAGDASSNLYARFINTATREIDVTATEVYAFPIDEQGHPIAIGVGGIPAVEATEAVAVDLRQRVQDELRAIAALPPGDPALEDLNRRVRSQIVAQRRALGKFVNSPPGFGFRHGGGAWMSHIATLERLGGFRRPVTLAPQLAAAEALLDGGTNPWTERIAAWKLTEVTPTALIARPSPELLASLAAEREARLSAQRDAIQARYQETDPAAALARFQADYDAETAAMEALAEGQPMPRFIDNPPLTLDDQLRYRAMEVGSQGIPLVRSTFDNMSSVTHGLALRVDSAPPESFVYLAALPALLSEVGIADGDEILSHPQVIERQQNEILGIGVRFDVNEISGRVELMLTGSGNDQAEGRAALAWMGRLLYHADWRPENLSRIRDVVSEELTGLRQTMRGSEESWVNNPARAWRHQDNPWLLTTDSFLTRTHQVQRLRWLLEGDDPAAVAAAVTLLKDLSGAAEGHSRGDLEALLKGLRAGEGGPAWASALVTAAAGMDPAARQLTQAAVADLGADLGDVPDATLAGDWRYLCAQIAADLGTPPADALRALTALRDRLLVASGARMYAVGNDPNLDGLLPDVGALVAGLTPGETFAAAPRDGQPRLLPRLADRGVDSAPAFVGLLNPNTQGGVLIHAAAGPSYADLDQDSLLDFLTGQLFGGGGAHSLFMRTWGAGLAYSNGIRSSPATGEMRYYAERSPELPRTMAFVADVLATADRDPALAEYAISQAFTSSRAGRGYEERAQAMAADLVDGRAPEQVRAFRTAVLGVRDMPELADALFARMERVYGSVVVGYGIPAAEAEAATYMSIGPDAQLSAWERYVARIEGEGTRLVRLTPRDFWLPGPAAGASP